MQDDVASWDYIVELSRFRPRDIIVLLSFALPQAKARHDNPLLFEDNDFHKSLDEYADYLRREINDEIFTHWPKWQEALTACFDVIYCTGVFERTQFASAYEARRTVQNAVSSDNALKELYKFSVIGFNCLTGIEEASWVFSHQPRSQWDSRACVFKINEGLRRIVPTRTAGSILQRVLESNRHVSYKQDIPLGVITLPHFVVNQNVLRPEVVTSFYLARFLACNTNLFKDAKVVDMGSGSGIQGIVMALLGAKHVFLTDVSPASVENSQFNADLYDLGSATTVVQGDLFSGLCDRVDLIVFNHPFFQGNPAETDLIGRAIQDPGDLIHRFFDDARKFAPRIVMPFLHAAGKTNDPGVQAPKHGYSIAKQHRLRSTLILNPGDVSIYELEYSGG
jgi:predicted RNA methylase